MSLVNIICNRTIIYGLYVSFTRRGYADGEIEALFAKYDIDGDRVLDEDEQRRMQADLDDQKVKLRSLQLKNIFITPLMKNSLLELTL